MKINVSYEYVVSGATGTVVSSTTATSVPGRRRKPGPKSARHRPPCRSRRPVLVLPLYDQHIVHMYIHEHYPYMT